MCYILYVLYTLLGCWTRIKTTRKNCSASNPFNNIPVNIFSVDNSEYPHFISLNFVDYPVIADSQFPVSFEGFSERLSVSLGE